MGLSQSTSITVSFYNINSITMSHKFMFLLAICSVSTGLVNSSMFDWGMSNMFDTLPVFPVPSWISSWMFPVSQSGLLIQVINITEESLRINCTWIGQGAEQANLTWFVGEDKAREEEVEEVENEVKNDVEEGNEGGEEGGEGMEDSKQKSRTLVLNLDWSERNTTAGDGVMVTCVGQTGSVEFSSQSQATQLIVVPGAETEPEPEKDPELETSQPQP